jgi:hypothetical protein
LDAQIVNEMKQRGIKCSKITIFLHTTQLEQKFTAILEELDDILHKLAKLQPFATFYSHKKNVIV